MTGERKNKGDRGCDAGCQDNYQGGRFQNRPLDKWDVRYSTRNYRHLIEGAEVEKLQPQSRRGLQ